MEEWNSHEKNNKRPVGVHPIGASTDNHNNNNNNKRKSVQQQSETREDEKANWQLPQHPPTATSNKSGALKEGN